MALKGRRHELYTDIQCFGNSVMERGGIVCFTTVGSGAPMDQAAQLVGYSSASSGATVAGMLLNDMVNYDQTKQHINWHKDEVQVGGKCTLGLRGWWVTNMIVGTPAQGDYAVLTSSGKVTPLTVANYNAGAWAKSVNPMVGKFRSTLDEDGYAEVMVGTDTV